MISGHDCSIVLAMLTLKVSGMRRRGRVETAEVMPTTEKSRLYNFNLLCKLTLCKFCCFQWPLQPYQGIFFSLMLRYLVPKPLPTRSCLLRPGHQAFYTELCLLCVFLWDFKRFISPVDMRETDPSIPRTPRTAPKLVDYMQCPAPMLPIDFERVAFIVCHRWRRQ